MATQEYTFWLDILNDHVIILANRLTPLGSIYRSENIGLQNAIGILQTSLEDGLDINPQMFSLVNNLIGYKKDILQGLLDGQQIINLPPTFIQHMIDEAQECLQILEYMGQHGVPPPVDILKTHKLWLNDAYGHADALCCNLDIVEEQWRKEFKICRRDFRILHEKCMTFIDYQQSKEFPAIAKLTQDSQVKTSIFVDLLNEAKELSLDKMLLGNVDDFLLQHMIKESLYYLDKISPFKDLI